MKVAVVQFEIAPNAPELNIGRMTDFIKEASEKKCQLVVFPEDAVTGPLEGQLNHVGRAAEFLVKFQALAKNFKIDIVPGSWTVGAQGKIYNSTCYINSDGSVAGSYSKINLWESERATITPGVASSVFPTKHGMVGLGICWDMAYPELFKEMTAKGANLFIVPTYWSYTKPGLPNKEDKKKDEKVIDSVTVTRAFENAAYLIMCNAAGEYRVGEVHSVLMGHSRITAPTGIVQAVDNNKEQVLYEEIELVAAKPQI